MNFYSHLQSPESPLVPSGNIAIENHCFNGKIHYKLPFSIAMLNYQRVFVWKPTRSTWIILNLPGSSSPVTPAPLRVRGYHLHMLVDRPQIRSMKVYRKSEETISEQRETNLLFRYLLLPLNDISIYLLYKFIVSSLFQYINCYLLWYCSSIEVQ